MTAVIVLVLIGVTVGIDVWLYLTGRETISQLAQKSCAAHSWIAAALGALLWHLLTGGQ